MTTRTLAAAALAATISTAANAEFITVAAGPYWITAETTNAEGSPDSCLIRTQSPDRHWSVLIGVRADRDKFELQVGSDLLPAKAVTRALSFQVVGYPQWIAVNDQVIVKDDSLSLMIDPASASQFVHQITAGTTMHLVFGNDQPWEINLSGTTSAWEAMEPCLNQIAPAAVASVRAGQNTRAFAQAPAPYTPPSAPRVAGVQTYHAPPPAAQPSPIIESPRPDMEVATGTGFFITSEGHLLTNAHVVRDCKSITVEYGAAEHRAARLLARDQTNDLAIVASGLAPTSVAAFRSSVRLGAQIAVYGFPLSGLLASGGNFTLGNVTALAGIRDDSRILQISAPVQPGNSGGPLLDESGAVVGVVVAKLNAIKLAMVTEDLSQNVNFAIKVATALAFIETQGLGVRIAPANETPLRPADLADKAKSFTALVECMR